MGVCEGGGHALQVLLAVEVDLLWLDDTLLNGVHLRDRECSLQQRAQLGAASYLVPAQHHWDVFA
jgi:pyruvate carboxylase